jgi:flagellin-like hook-associated protein FlgL
MSGITLSSAVRENLLSLQNTAKLTADTQSKLSTGLKVRSAVDNPTSFFTSQSLNARAGDLNALLDNTGLAVQTLQAADEGLSALTNLVQQARATATQALNTQITATTASSSDTGAAGTAVAIGTSGIGTGDTITVSTTGADGSTITVTATATAGRDLDGLASVINAQTGITASFANGVLSVSGDGGRTVTISGSVGDALGLTGTFTNGTNRDQFVTDFNNLRTQIDQLAGDASFNGVNLLDGDNLTVTFNETGTSTLEISGVTYDAAGLGISAQTNTGFSTDSGVQSALTSLNGALTSLRSQASTFGNNLAVVENRQDFTNNLINTLESGAAGLTLADTNEEGANLLALQTRQQLGSISLSLANQADQAVLRLF